MNSYPLITSKSNTNIQLWKSLLTESKTRKAEKKVVVEGRNVVEDLLKAKLVKTLIVTQKWIGMASDVETYIVSDEAYRAFSQLENPEGVAAVVSLPESKPLSFAQKLLILDRLQDPGNVGTILRTATAFGIDHVAFLQPSCDPWNEKVIRAGKGAHFSLSISSCTIDDIQAWSNEKNAVIYVADLDGASSETLREAHAPYGLVMGRETSGPDPEIAHFGKKVSISMKGKIESLNVAQAGAILLYLLNQT